MASRESSEAMSVDQLGARLAAMGNHEGEALLVWAMDDETYHSPPALEGLLRDRSYEDGPPYISKRSPESWVDKSLLPAGFVETGLTAAGTRGYRLTERGLALKPLVGIVLPAGDQADRPLGELWGQSASRGEGGLPLARYKILSLLLDELTPLSHREVARRLGMESSPRIVSKQLSSLLEDELISAGPQGIYAVAQYEMPREMWELPASLVNHTLSYARRAKGNPVTLTEIAASYLTKYPDISGGLATLESIYEGISQLVGEPLIRPIAQAQVVPKSEGVSLTAEQREFFAPFFADLEAFRNQDTEKIEGFLQRGEQFWNDLGAVKRALARAHEYWGQPIRLSEDTVRDAILQAIQPQPLSLRQIRHAIARARGSQVSRPQVKDALKKLTDNRVVEINYLSEPSTQE